VDAPRSQLHIGSGKYGDVQVSVKGIERDSLVFNPLKAKKGIISLSGSTLAQQQLLPF